MASAGPYQARVDRAPPIKGAFPLDHENLCRKQMVEYMLCLQKHDAQNSECRDLAKNYFRCRMDNNLMERSEWKLLGYGDLPPEKSDR